MLRVLYLSTSIATGKLLVSITREWQEPKQYNPGPKSAKRINALLKDVKPTRVFIDNFGPSVHYNLSKSLYIPPQKVAQCRTNITK